MTTADFRYQRAGYVALNVTDLARTHDFATGIYGLTFTGEGPSGERFYRSGPRHHEVVLQPAAEPGFVRAGWELETEDDVSRAFHHFRQLGLKPRRVPAEERAALGLSISDAFRVREPVNGVEFEYYSRMEYLSRPLEGDLTTFKRFAHVGIGVPDVQRSTQFLLDNMGFLASDIVGDYTSVFMRPWPVSDHHGFGYLPTRTGAPAFHHLAFLVDSIDDIGKLFNRIEEHAVGRAFGIGRHPTSGSVHLYITDPDGMLWEYTLGMEQFPETGYRGPRFMSAAPEDADLWQAKPKPEFVGKGGVVTGDAGIDEALTELVAQARK